MKTRTAQRYRLPGVGLLSYSGMSMFLSCPRKYAYTFIDGIEPDYSDTSAMDIGSAVHRLVEKDGAVAEGDTLTAVDGNLYHAAKVRTGYRKYRDVAADLPKITHHEVQLISEEHQYIGHVDGFGIDPDGRWRMLELKTTSRFDAVKWATKSVDLQISLYTVFSREFAHRELLEMGDFEGVSYRTIALSGKKPLAPTKTRPLPETPEAYEARIASDAQVYHQMVMPTEEARSSALQSFQAAKEAIHGLGGKSSRAHKNPGNCFSYGRPCQFFNHCWGIKLDEAVDRQETISYDL